MWTAATEEAFDLFLPRAVCIDGHAAADCLKDRKLKTSRLRIPPPFPVFWLEWSVAWGDAFGCLSVSDRIEGEEVRKLNGLGISIPAEEEDAPIYKTTVLPVRQSERKRHIDVGFWLMIYYTTLQGDQLGGAERKGHHLLLHKSKLMARMNESHCECAVKDFIWYYAAILWLLTVRNITLVDGEPSSSKHSRHMAKALKRPRFAYKTVAVSTNIRKSNNGSTVGLTRELPLHTVMGHFATYTEEKPLFGKYSGTFYIPGHLRGKKAEGEIEKLYNTSAV